MPQKKKKETIYGINKWNLGIKYINKDKVRKQLIK